MKPKRLITSTLSILTLAAGLLAQVGCVCVFFLIFSLSCVAPITSAGEKAEVGTLTGIRAKMQNKVDARDATITGLHSELNLRDNEISAVRGELTLRNNEISALKSEVTGLDLELSESAGGDINSTTALIIAILCMPACFIVYTVSSRFDSLEKFKCWLKGKEHKKEGGGIL